MLEKNDKKDITNEIPNSLEKNECKNIGKIKPTKELLVDLYINKKLSAEKIHIDYNVSNVYGFLRKYNILRINKRENGFLRLEHLKGKKFGKLLVLNREDKAEYKESRWNCLCDCGKNVIIRGRGLLSGGSTSCGCIRAGYEEISKTHINNIKHNAKARNLSFEITPKQMWDLFIQQSRRCALSGVQIQFGSKYKKIETTASLDRFFKRLH